MITAILITVLPTLLFYILLEKKGFHIKSNYLRITFAWFVGLYVFTFTTFFIAVSLSYITTDILLKAVYMTLFLTQISMLTFAKDVGRLFLAWKKIGVAMKQAPSIHFILIFSFLFFSTLFYLPHLVQADNRIFTSPIYWDFHWHAALIQNFIHGDNFPPQNEAFGGIPHTYHYFWGVVAAIYGVAGLSLSQSINFVSVTSLFFIFMAIIGCSETFFQTKKVGIFAIILTITSSSLHFIYSLNQHSTLSFSDLIATIMKNQQHPFIESFILPSNPFGYQGVMFNMFYFLEERQLLFGILYLLLCIYLLSQKKNYSTKKLFLLGVFMGSFFLWHLYITIMLLCALVFLTLFDSEKKKTLILLSGFGSVFGAHVIYFLYVTHSFWFDKNLMHYPQLNFTFSKGNSQIVSLWQFFAYYVFSYGIKLYFLFAGIFILMKKQKHIALLLLALIIPTFLLVNSVQLSPGSISENHKWLRSVNVIIDFVAAFGLYKLFFEGKSFKKLFIGSICILLLTFSGIIELMPFLNSKATYTYANYPSSMSNAIQKHTSPDAIFVGFDKDAINLAGRKLFLGSPLGGDMDLKIDERKKIINEIYVAASKEELCKAARTYPINYIEFENEFLLPYLRNTNNTEAFLTHNDYNEEVKFVNVQRYCSK